MSKHAAVALVTALVALAAWCGHSSAGGLGDGGTAPLGFTPRVPVSALGIPTAWFDPSKFHVSTSVSVGSGFGSGVNALQVTSLSYQVARPLWMNVSVGNAWGPGSARNASSSFFLEGLDVGYRPFPSLQVQIHYRDLRSPLQAPYARDLWGY